MESKYLCTFHCALAGPDSGITRSDAHLGERLDVAPLLRGCSAREREPSDVSEASVQLGRYSVPDLACRASMSASCAVEELLVALDSKHHQRISHNPREGKPTRSTAPLMLLSFARWSRALRNIS